MDEAKAFSAFLTARQGGKSELVAEYFEHLLKAKADDIKEEVDRKIHDHLIVGLDHGIHDTSVMSAIGSKGEVIIVDEFWGNKRTPSIYDWFSDLKLSDYRLGEDPIEDYNFGIKKPSSDLKSPFDKYGKYERIDPMPRNVDRKKVLAKRAKNKANKKRARHGK